MAENKQEKRTFKWGDSEYLLDDLLKLHADQERHYYDFARKKGGYSDDSLAGLRKAIAHRIDAVKSGQIFSADGVLDTDVADNTTNTIKNGVWKKATYVDQDNTEWAKHYLNKLVANLKPHNKQPKTSGWDINKYGFAAYLNGAGGLSAKDVFEQYDKRSEKTPDAPRGYGERDALLKEQLGKYHKWLTDKKFNFAENDSDWDDSFMTDLDDLIKNYDNLDTRALKTRLRKLGADALGQQHDYVTAFTSDKWDLSKSDADIKSDSDAAAAEAQRKAEEQAFATFAKGQYTNFQALEDNNLGGTYFTTGGDHAFEMSDEEFDEWANTHTNDRTAYIGNLKKSFWENPFNTQIASEYLPLAHRYGWLKETNIDGKRYLYDPKTIDRQKNRAVIIDPDSGEIKHTFIGDIENEWRAIKNKWRIDNNYLDPSEKYTRYNEEGGVLYMQTGGDFDLEGMVERELAAKSKARAAASGKTEEQQKAADRIVGSKNNATIANPDAGFTATDIARLTSIGADIVSMFLDPVSGVAVGLGSSLTNFGADWAEDGLDWGDVKNLGINVGFDLLGAIPIFGDAVGTGSKITKHLIKWAPRMMAGLAAFQGVRNFDGMMESWGKLTTKGEKMTVQDWRNIQQSIGLVTGTTRAIRNKAAQNRTKQAAKLDGVVGVNVYNKQTQKIEQILVDGDVAKNIRAAKGDKAKIEAELSKLDDLKGKFGETGDFEVATQKGEWQNPWQKVEGADGKTSREWMGFRKDGRAQVSDVYDFNRIQSGNFKGIDQSPTTKIDHRGKLTGEQIDAQYNKLLEDAGIEAMVKRVNTDVEARNSAIASAKSKHQQIKRDLDAAQSNLRGQKSEADLLAAKAAAQAELGRLPNNQALIKAENALAHNQAIIDGGIAKQQALVAARDRNLANMELGRSQKVTLAKQDLADALKKRSVAQNKLQNALKKDAKKGITKDHKRLKQSVTDADKAVALARQKVKAAEKQYNNLDKAYVRPLSAKEKAAIQALTGPQRIAAEKAAKQKLSDRERGMQQFQQKNSQLQSEIQKAKNEVKKLKGVEAQRAAYREHRAKLDEARQGLNMRAKTEADIRKLQQRLNHAAGVNSQVSASHHTRAYLELQNKLASLQSANPTIGGRAITWDMDAILQKYGFSQPKAYKSGGQVNKNRINKFIDYVKG